MKKYLGLLVLIGLLWSSLVSAQAVGPWNYINPASLDLVIGTDVQAWDADLDTYAGITPSANIQTLLGSATFAAANTNLGLGTGDSPVFTGLDLTGLTDGYIPYIGIGALVDSPFRTDGTDSAIGKVIVTGSLLNLPQQNDAATPTISFGDGDTGIYEQADGTLAIGLESGAGIFYISSGGISPSQNGFYMRNVTATATVPSVIANKTDIDSGLCWPGADTVALCAGGVTGVQITESGSAISSVDLAGPARSTTASYRRYYHVALASFDPGASGAEWTSGDGNTDGGWDMDVNTETLETKTDIHADWDGVSNPTLELYFDINVNNGGGGGGDTVNFDVTFYYKGVGDTATKTQTVNGTTTIGTAAQWTKFEQEIELDENIGGGNDLDVGDIVYIIINLNTGDSEVDDVTLTAVSFYYSTTHVGIESGDV